MNVRIISTPPGEAPEEIRRGWIGLVLPVSPRYGRGGKHIEVGVVTGPKSLLGTLFGLFSGRAQRTNGYPIESSVALELLAKHSPAAASWWGTNTPRFFEPGRHFLFAAECCEEVPEGGAAE